MNSTGNLNDSLRSDVATGEAVSDYQVSHHLINIQEEETGASSDNSDQVLLEDDSAFQVDSLIQSESEQEDTFSNEEDSEVDSLSLQGAFDSHLANYTNTALEIFEGKNLFHDLRNEIDSESLHAIYDTFINYNSPFKLDPGDTNNKTFLDLASHLKNCICNIKHKLRTNFSQLLESEQRVQLSLSSLQKMKSHTTQLEEFYGLIENTEIENKFRQLTQEAYQSKSKTIDLSDELKEYRNHLSKHLMTIQSLREVNCLNMKPICSLCLDKEIDHVALPCGHTFCRDCIHKCENCGFCRRNIMKSQKIFIG